MKKWLFYTLIGIFAAVFLVSGFFLVRYLTESVRSAKTYDTLALMVAEGRREPPASTAPEPESSQPGQTLSQEQTPFTEVTAQDGRIIQVLPEYAEVFALNNDLVGWIQIPGTDINYPVVQRPAEKDYYLHRDFYGKSSSHGTIYIKEDCDIWKPSDNLTVYGHRMKDGSMFAGLKSYMDAEFCRENPYIYLDSLQQHRTYQVLAVFTQSASDPDGFLYHEFVQAGDVTEFDWFVSRCKDLSLYDTGVEAQWEDQFITLSTCEYSQENGRLVVVAKRIDEP